MKLTVKEAVESWTKLHYLVYLYVCIGKSDYSLIDVEIEEIFDKLSKLDYSDDEKKRVFKEVLKIYNQHTDSEIYDFIKEYNQANPFTEEDKKMILKDLEDIMEADGIVKDVEMIMFRYIKKTLED